MKFLIPLIDCLEYICSQQIRPVQQEQGSDRRRDGQALLSISY